MSNKIDRIGLEIRYEINPKVYKDVLEKILGIDMIELAMPQTNVDYKELNTTLDNLHDIKLIKYRGKIQMSWGNDWSIQEMILPHDVSFHNLKKSIDCKCVVIMASNLLSSKILEELVDYYQRCIKVLVIYQEQVRYASILKLHYPNGVHFFHLSQTKRIAMALKSINQEPVKEKVKRMRMNWAVIYLEDTLGCSSWTDQELVKLHDNLDNLLIVRDHQTTIASISFKIAYILFFFSLAWILCWNKEKGDLVNQSTTMTTEKLLSLIALSASFAQSIAKLVDHPKFTFFERVSTRSDKASSLYSGSTPLYSLTSSSPFIKESSLEVCESSLSTIYINPFNTSNQAYFCAFNYPHFTGPNVTLTATSHQYCTSNTSISTQMQEEFLQSSAYLDSMFAIHIDNITTYGFSGHVHVSDSSHYCSVHLALTVCDKYTTGHNNKALANYVEHPILNQLTDSIYEGIIEPSDSSLATKKNIDKYVALTHDNNPMEVVAADIHEKTTSMEEARLLSPSAIDPDQEEEPKQVTLVVIPQPTNSTVICAPYSHSACSLSNTTMHIKAHNRNYLTNFMTAMRNKIKNMILSAQRKIKSIFMLFLLTFFED